MMQYLPLLLKGLAAGGNGGLMSALGGGDAGLGSMAGTPMAGAQGPTQGSGLMGALSGGGLSSFQDIPNQETEETPRFNAVVRPNYNIANGLIRRGANV